MSEKRTDVPVKLPDYLIDELFRASVRVGEEVIKLTKRPIHDGVECVLVPEQLWIRLEAILGRCLVEDLKNWRP